MSVIPENVRADTDKYFNQEMSGLLNSNLDFYKRVVDNEVEGKCEGCFIFITL